MNCRAGVIACVLPYWAQTDCSRDRDNEIRSGPRSPIVIESGDQVLFDRPPFQRLVVATESLSEISSQRSWVQVFDLLVSEEFLVRPTLSEWQLQ